MIKLETFIRLRIANFHGNLKPTRFVNIIFTEPYFVHHCLKKESLIYKKKKKEKENKDYLRILFISWNIVCIQCFNPRSLRVTLGRFYFSTWCSQNPKNSRNFSAGDSPGAFSLLFFNSLGKFVQDDSRWDWQTVKLFVEDFNNDETVIIIIKSGGVCTLTVKQTVIWRAVWIICASLLQICLKLIKGIATFRSSEL